MEQLQLLVNWNGLPKGTIIEAGPGRKARLIAAGIAGWPTTQTQAAEPAQPSAPEPATKKKKTKGAKP